MKRTVVTIMIFGLTAILNACGYYEGYQGLMSGSSAFMTKPRPQQAEVQPR
jgi:hypothetical protein